MKYKVLARRLNYPVDEAIIRRILGGEHDIPREQRGEVMHRAGEIVEDVPKSLAINLLNNGDIEEVVEE